MNADKAEIRKLIKEREKAYASYLKLWDKGVFENFLKLPEYERARTILFYYSMGYEPDTHRLINKALSDGKRIALPRAFRQGRMVACEVADINRLVAGNFGILEPPCDWLVLKREELDMVVVPAAAFDRRGIRLGRGGGYYDRYLENSNVFSVGLTRERFIFDELPSQPHDIKVACIVTEKNIARP